MTPRQAADLIGCSVPQVRHLIRKGTLRATKQPMHTYNGKVCGFEYRVDRKQVLRYANTTQHGGWPRGKSRSN